MAADAETEARAGAPARVVGGTVHVLRMLDVADAIDLESARARARERGARRGSSNLRGPEKGPAGVVLAAEPLDLDVGAAVVSGLELRVRLRLFDFGVASIRFATDVAPGTTCGELARLAARLEREP